ncbi:SCO family protein [Aureivirga sp. CE67]|uniref:SCO family protein n=1 Tax=Aureivirga sp. CE67 TaxID=1788983 RepID=UPI0018CAB60E|nr:SCO family protein [Aureivirga sp. CE67]
MKKNSYIGISFIILIFGIYVAFNFKNQFSKTYKTENKEESETLVTFEKVPDFSFTNQEGKTITNKDFDGKVYVLEFFFTTCPTICPIMNDNMMLVQEQYYGNKDFGIASISINPEHDTPEILKKYAEDHKIEHKNWHLLTGPKDKVYELSNTGFKLYANENPEAEGGFEHSGLFALIDKNGNIRSRKIEEGGFENPIKFYDGLDKKHIQMLKEDIEILLKENKDGSNN